MPTNRHQYSSRRTRTTLIFKQLCENQGSELRGNFSLETTIEFSKLGGVALVKFVLFSETAFASYSRALHELT